MELLIVTAHGYPGGGCGAVHAGGIFAEAAGVLLQIVGIAFGGLLFAVDIAAYGAGRAAGGRAHKSAFHLACAQAADESAQQSAAHSAAHGGIIGKLFVLTQAVNGLIALGIIGDLCLPGGVAAAGAGGKGQRCGKQGCQGKSGRAGFHGRLLVARTCYGAGRAGLCRSSE